MGGPTRIETGTVIHGSWKVEEKIGEGNMGVVYRAYNRHFGESSERALKVLKPALATNDEVRARFLLEAKSLHQIKSDHVISLFDFGMWPDDKGEPYFMMEYLSGGDTLDRWSRGQPVSSGDIIELADQICSGLRAAHAKGLAHRDLKPANVYVTKVDAALVVKLFDFGLAKDTEGLFREAVRNAPKFSLVQTQGFLGTPVYVSPEQASGDNTTAKSADIYSLGAVLYELIAGEPPIRFPVLVGKTVDEQIQEVVGIIQKQKPKPLATVAPACPSWLAALVERCLAKEAAARPASIEEVQKALRDGRSQPARAIDTINTVVIRDSDLVPLPNLDATIVQDEARTFVKVREPAEQTYVDNGPTIREIRFDDIAATIVPPVTPVGPQPIPHGRLAESSQTQPVKRIARNTGMLVGALAIGVLLIVIAVLMITKLGRKHAWPNPWSGQSTTTTDVDATAHAGEPVTVTDDKPIQCPTGQEWLASSRFCCWVGQSRTATSCVGPPTRCPELMVATANGCAYVDIVHRQQLVGIWRNGPYSFTISFDHDTPTVVVDTGTPQNAVATWQDPVLHIVWGGIEESLTVGADGTLTATYDGGEDSFTRDP